MKEWVAVLRAADAAARWHVHQRRKGSAREPYVNHLLEVASLVAEATEGKDTGLVIAALLHDAIEDQEVPIELIEDEFGKRVADVVSEVTDDKALPKEERKTNQIRTASEKSNDAKIIKLGDKISNMRAVAFSPAPDWSVKRRLEYIRWARDVVDGLRGASPWLRNNSTMRLARQRARSQYEVANLSKATEIKATLKPQNSPGGFTNGLRSIDQDTCNSPRL